MNELVPMYKYPIVDDDGWKSLNGELPVKMTNDYLFRALLQSDNETLKALLASLLRLDADQIKSARITNSIPLGIGIDSKTFIMDVSVELNDLKLVNLEMQVIKEPWWCDRSLSYICRSYDNLNRGASYDQAKPVRQIAFCDFTLFRKAPEFYATYKILNEHNPKIVYSEKLVISNVDLTRIDLATDVDKEYRTDEWARLFKAETWEDMKMLAEKNSMMERTISGIWQLTEDNLIREQCRAREEWIINDNRKNEIIEQQRAAMDEYEINDKRKNEIIEQQRAAIEEYEINDNRKNEIIEQQKREMEDLKQEIAALKGKA